MPNSAGHYGTHPCPTKSNRPTKPPSLPLPSKRNPHRRQKKKPLLCKSLSIISWNASARVPKQNTASRKKSVFNKRRTLKPCVQARVKTTHFRFSSACFLYRASPRAKTRRKKSSYFSGVTVYNSPVFSLKYSTLPPSVHKRSKW